MRKLAGIVCLTLSTGLVTPSKAQCAGHWVYGPDQGIPGVGAHYTPGVTPSADVITAWDPDGAGPMGPWAVVGGHYALPGQVRANNIAAWDGVEWRWLGGGVNGTVRALTVYHGEMIAGGGPSLNEPMTTVDDRDPEATPAGEPQSGHYSLSSRAAFG